MDCVNGVYGLADGARSLISDGLQGIAQSVSSLLLDLVYGVLNLAEGTSSRIESASSLNWD